MARTMQTEWEPKYDDDFEEWERYIDDAEGVISQEICIALTKLLSPVLESEPGPSKSKLQFFNDELAKLDNRKISAHQLQKVKNDLDVYNHIATLHPFIKFGVLDALPDQCRLEENIIRNDYLFPFNQIWKDSCEEVRLAFFYSSLMNVRSPEIWTELWATFERPLELWIELGELFVDDMYQDSLELQAEFEFIQERNTELFECLKLHTDDIDERRH
jgi:hypothetical protein